jgi:hypothetical protein
MTAGAFDRPVAPSRLPCVAGSAFWLMVVVTLASAFLRLAEEAAVGGLAVDLARGLHRVAATAALLVAIAVAVLGWDRFRPLGASRAAAAALVVLGIGLAFLGRFTPSAHPLVAFGNPLGGLAMTALAWWLWRASAPRAARAAPAVAGWILLAAAFGVVAALVRWPPGLGFGLALQVLATVAVAAGGSILHAAAAR